MFRKLVLINLFWFICQICLAGQTLPQLQSDSTTVNISINGRVAAAWSITPETKPWADPDVFMIDRSLHDTKVSYISNSDSLSFLVQPGARFDFVIVMKNRGRFLMGITTFPPPRFQQVTIWSFVYGFFLLVLLVIRVKRNMISTEYFLWFGIIAPLLFWILTITGGYIHGDYNHLHQVVSEIGAIRTKSELYMSVGESLLAFVSAISVIGLYRACRASGLNTIPVLTILSLSFSMIWAALFPMHHDLHGAMGPIPLLLNLGALLSIFLWRGKPYRELRIISAIGLILMMLILLRTIPALGNHWEGLIQRFFYTGWTIWSIGTSVFFIRRIHRHSGNTQNP